MFRPMVRVEPCGQAWFRRAHTSGAREKSDSAGDPGGPGGTGSAGGSHMAHLREIVHAF